MGDRVVVDDVALTVLDMDAHRIARVRAAKVSAEEDFEDLSEEHQQELAVEFEAEECSQDDETERNSSNVVTDTQLRGVD